MKPKYKQTLRATTTAKLQLKIQDYIKQGWEPDGEIQVDYTTGEVIQLMTKPRKV